MKKLVDKKRVLVTAALPYSNGRLHVGHIAGAYLPADIYVRYLRMSGRDVRFICGSDDHGVAIVLSAQKEGKTPAEISEFFNRRQAEDFRGLGIHFDIYGSTSRNPHHAKISQDLFVSLHEKGYFDKQRSRQFYDDSKQMFLPDRFVKGRCGYCDTPDQNGDQCENCGKILDIDTLLEARSIVSGRPAVIKETVHWFLDLSRFEGQVSEWVGRSILRDFSRSYVQGLLSTGLVKRSMTRDLDWGIPVPLDDPEAKDKVLYVWFDAPIGYISNTYQLCEERRPQENFSDWWRSEDTDVIHFIGEDNTIFHCVIWIAMLQADGGYQLPRGVIVNQFLNFQAGAGGVEKISKSRGTAIWIEDYLAEGNQPDTLRYYLTSIAPESARTVYRPEDLIQRHNTDLANALGNFVHRILSFNLKYVGKEVPACPAEKVTDADRAFHSAMRSTHAAVTEHLERHSFKSALESVMAFVRDCNRYADEKAPWVTRKTDMDATKVTLWHAIQAIKLLTVELTPFLPFSAAAMAEMLCLDHAGLGWEDALTPLEPGAPLGEPKILFTKIESE